MNNNEFKYYDFLRKELITEIIGQNNKILDIGCGEGLTCYELKKTGIASEVIGIEINPNAAAKATAYLDNVVCGDIELLCIEELFSTSFDYIICGDILEHLRYPWTQLFRLAALIKKNGKIVISLPNIRYWSVLLPLVFKGDWNYTDAGILDRTHLRFFTKKTAIELCQQAGFTEIVCKPNFGRKLNKIINILSLGALQDFVSPQWIIICQK